MAASLHTGRLEKMTWRRAGRQAGRQEGRQGGREEME
jgi:hypothetical protein